MNKILFIVAILLLAVSCKRTRPPGDLIHQEELVPVLVDLHMVYSIQTTNDFQSISIKVDSIDTHSYIFEKHGITKVQFDSTIAWFSRRPELFTEVYDEVVMLLSQRSDSISPVYD